MIVQDIAKPLGIRSVIFGEPALVDPAREPWPHVREGARWTPVSPVPRSRYGYHIFNPAGGISLTLEGFGRWMQAHLTGEMGSGLLPRPMFKLLYTPGWVPGASQTFGIGTVRGFAGPLDRTQRHQHAQLGGPPDADGPRYRRVRCGQCPAFGQCARHGSCCRTRWSDRRCRGNGRRRPSNHHCRKRMGQSKGGLWNLLGSRAARLNFRTASACPAASNCGGAAPRTATDWCCVSPCPLPGDTRWKARSPGTGITWGRDDRVGRDKETPAISGRSHLYRKYSAWRHHAGRGTTPSSS